MASASEPGRPPAAPRRDGPHGRLTWRRIRGSLQYRIAAGSFRLFESSKSRLHALAGSRPRATLFIFGCQRSGTTHLERLLRADPRSSVFGEFGELSIAPDRTVWRPLPDLKHRLDRAEGRYVVARSLLASHRAGDVLAALPEAQAVWMFRPAEEVVGSMLRKWSTRFEAISRRVEADSDGTWELETLWQRLHQNAETLSGCGPGSEGRLRDLYGLFWHARNAAYFEAGLDAHPRICLLGYQTLLGKPSASIARLTETMGLGRPPLAFPLRTARVNPRPARLGYFSPEVQALCDALQRRLVAAEEAGR